MPSLALLAATLVLSLGAGLVRGYAGFGFSALTVTGMALFVPPASIVPALLVLEVMASAAALRGARDDVDQPWLRALLWGNLVAVPVGMAALVMLAPQQTRLLLGLGLLIGAVAVRGARGLRPGSGLRVGTGLASGLVNGLAASGGVVAAMVMAATPLQPRQLRATMVAFQLFTPAYALAWVVLWSFIGLGGGPTTPLLDAATATWIALLAPGMTLGLIIGQRAHGMADPQRQRRFVLDLLAAMALLAVARAMADLLIA